MLAPVVPSAPSTSWLSTSLPPWLVPMASVVVPAVPTQSLSSWIEPVWRVFSNSQTTVSPSATAMLQLVSSISTGLAAAPTHERSPISWSERSPVSERK